MSTTTAPSTTPTATMTNLAYSIKGASTMQNQRIQKDRDSLRCRCGHLNVSHGYGPDGGATWPEGSRIGLGQCGIDRCTCQAFNDETETQA